MSRALATLCAVFAVLSAIGLTAQRPGDAGAPAIRLKPVTFRPAAGEQPDLPAGLVIAGYDEGQRGYYLVQFAGPVQDAWKASVEAAGAELIEYIPDFAFKVRMAPGQATRVAALGDVAWVGLFHPAYKLPAALPTAQRALYRVRVERGANPAAAAAQVAATGAQVLSRQGTELMVAADASQVQAIAHVLDVAVVRPHLLRVKHNEAAAGIMGVTAANARGFTGSGETVAVADTGLGGGTAGTAHVSITSGRVAGIFNWPGVSDSCWSVTDDGAIDVDSGHGTHTSVSVLGGGRGGVGAGAAPDARLVFQATENWATMKGLCAFYYPSGYYLTGLPTDLRTLFQQAYDAGARVHSNSWGSAAAGDYTADSAYADAFVAAHPDMAITFSAGNEGIDANNDGAIDNDSMGAPATAKNVITVGASENARADGFPCDPTLAYTACAGQNATNTIFTYGTAWPADYPRAPISTDPSAGNAQQMAAFSSRGPTDDGRIKPDVVAPGTWVLSGYADLYQQGYDGSPNPKTSVYQYDGWGFPKDRDFKYMGGTSMSNPLVAGSAAVLRQYYKASPRSVASPSAALIKATLINTAIDLQDENNDGSDDNDFPIPNTHEGWGLVNLDAATSGAVQFADEGNGLATSATRTYASTPSGGALKITLVWSDYQSTESASVNLVNDLDLEVTSPNGTTLYRGNAFSAGWSATGGSADRRNNVENVYIAAPGSGAYAITVRGYNVPQGPQRFALVVSGGTLDSGSSPPPPPPAATMYLAALSGTGVGVSRNNWQARVTATVGTGTSGVVAGAAVTGTWSGGSSGTGTCTTTSNGSCLVSSASMSNKKASATFTVTGITAAGYTYTAAQNKVAASVTVAKP